MSRGLGRRRAEAVAVVHCPDCDTVRIAEPDRRWRTRRREGAVASLRCIGCGRPVGDKPTATVDATSYRRVLVASARALAGALVRHDDDPRTAAAAIDLVRAFTNRRYDAADLGVDRRHPDPLDRLRGELTLLTLHVGPGTTRPLLHAAEKVASAGGPPTDAQRDVLEHAARHLGH